MIDSHLSPEQLITNYSTMRHIERVRNILNLFIKELMERAEKHDQSKLQSPEVEAFTEYTPKLRDVTYGSAEYENFRKLMAPALEHHYANNRHHPEHFPKYSDHLTLALQHLLKHMQGDPSIPAMVYQRIEHDLEVAESSINNMNIIDVLEMLCDWKASSERHNDGNIIKSIHINTDRFKISPQLARILENTVKLFDGE